jgi:hypothetical protein
VIGAGAAGMMCAAQAGQRGRRVALIDHVATIGEKIRISGGGRCNFTNVNASPSQYLSSDPDYAAGALANYTAARFVALVERHRIPYHEKKLGQLFCDRSATDIIGMLKDECERGRVTWRVPCAVQGVAHDVAGFASRRRRAHCARRRSSSPPAASPCPRSARRRSPIASPSSSDSRWCRRARAGAARMAPEDLAVTASSRACPSRWKRRAATALSREPALHASRIVGTGDPAGVVVLERQGADRRRPAAGRRRRALARATATGNARLANLLAERLPKRVAQAVVRRARLRAPAARAERRSSARAH